MTEMNCSYHVNKVEKKSSHFGAVLPSSLLSKTSPTAAAAANSSSSSSRNHVPTNSKNLNHHAAAAAAAASRLPNNNNNNNNRSSSSTASGKKLKLLLFKRGVRISLILATALQIPIFVMAFRMGSIWVWFGGSSASGSGSSGLDHHGMQQQQQQQAKEEAASRGSKTEKQRRRGRENETLAKVHLVDYCRDPCNLTSPSSGALVTAGGNVTTIKPVPIVIISAIRPDYLRQVLESIRLQLNQTGLPSWLGGTKSPRLLFIHRHVHNEKNADHYDDVLALAAEHEYTVYLFEGLYDSAQPLNYNAAYTWYRMMRHLFFSGLFDVDEALIVEDDVVLAEDALLVSAAMFVEKRNRTDIHGITLGGWLGTNRIHAHPGTFHATACGVFQPMAYSISRVFFQQLEKKKMNQLLYKRKADIMDDWSMEITRRDFVRNLTVLTPTVGRMHHIGEVGMGASGRGDEKRPVSKAPPWNAWKEQLHGNVIAAAAAAAATSDDHHPPLQKKNHANSTTQGGGGGNDDKDHQHSQLYLYRLEPAEITDMFGFTCTPVRWNCGFGRAWSNHMKVGQLHYVPVGREGHSVVPRTYDDDLSSPLVTKGDVLPIYNVAASSVEDVIAAALSSKDAAAAAAAAVLSVDPKNAIDGNLFTRWSSDYTDHEWIQVDLGDESLSLSSPPLLSLQLHWEESYAKAYRVLLSNDGRSNWKTVYETHTSQGGIDIVNMKGMQGRYVRVDCQQRVSPYGFSLWEIVVRGSRHEASSPLIANSVTIPVVHAKASSIETDKFAAFRAVDGDFNTRWSSLSTDREWITVDLGEHTNNNQSLPPLLSIQLFWESAYAKRYQIQISNNDQDEWQTVHEEINGGAIDLINMTGWSGRYIRVHCTERGTAFGYSLWEIIIRGQKIGEQ